MARVPTIFRRGSREDKAPHELEPIREKSFPPDRAGEAEEREEARAEAERATREAAEAREAELRAERRAR